MLYGGLIMFEQLGDIVFHNILNPNLLTLDTTLMPQVHKTTQFQGQQGQFPI